MNPTQTETVQAPKPAKKGSTMTRIILGLLVGAAIGSILGYIGQCSSGTCPLTSTWWRGAIYGGIMGALFAGTGNS